MSCSPGLQQLQAASLPKPQSTARVPHQSPASAKPSVSVLLGEIQHVLRSKGIRGMEEWKNDGPGV